MAKKIYASLYARHKFVMEKGDAAKGVSPKYIQFHNSQYETEDPAEQKFLDKYAESHQNVIFDITNGRTQVEKDKAAVERELAAAKVRIAELESDEGDDDSKEASLKAELKAMKKQLAELQKVAEERQATIDELMAANNADVTAEPTVDGE